MKIKLKILFLHLMGPMIQPNRRWKMIAILYTSEDINTSDMFAAIMDFLHFRLGSTVVF